MNSLDSITDAETADGGSMAEIVAIWLKRFKGGPMDPVHSAEAVAGRGLTGNADQGGRRQVTLIDEARWAEAMCELGTDVDPSARRANVMLRGIDLDDSLGRSLRLGQCVLRIYNETRPCEQMEEAHPGLRVALGTRLRGGVFGEVDRSGVLAVGDTVEWIES